MSDRRKVVIKALNKPQLIAGLDLKTFGPVFLLCVIVFAVVSKPAAFLLLFLLGFTGQRVTKTDTQLPVLWLTSLRQKGSYDPFKHDYVEDRGSFLRSTLLENE